MYTMTRKLDVEIVCEYLFIFLAIFTTCIYGKHDYRGGNCSNMNFFTFWGQSQDVFLMDFDPVCDFLKGYKIKDEGSNIHIAVVACGDRLKETLVMAKSAVLLSDEKIHFHIFADEQLTPRFNSILTKWLVEVPRSLDFTVYPITYPTKEHEEEWKNLFKPCATQRLFIPYVLPIDVTDRILYVDTDILFMRPVRDIWHFFDRFNSSHIAALAPEHEWDRQGWYNRFARHPYFGERGVNSGVMLMNLKRMREAHWIDHIKSYYAEYRLKITWGDQDLINIFFHYFPEKLYVYPCHWNLRPDHCMYGLNCKQAERRGVSIVHGCRGVYHDEKQPVFKAIYRAFEKYDFATDLRSDFLIPLKDSIKKVESTGYCGAAGPVFTKQLERQINIKERCLITNDCSVGNYEPEDFSLEPAEEITKNDNNNQQNSSSNNNVEKKNKEISAKKNHTSKTETVAQIKENKTHANEIENKAYELSDSLFQRIVGDILNNFPKIAKHKLLYILREHYTRLIDAHERHVDIVVRPQENDDTALLSGALHEEMLGYLSSNIEEMSSADNYLMIMEAVIKRLQSPQKDNSIHLVVVACGDRLEEPIVMMKSALLLAKRFIHFHVFAEDHLQPQFKKVLKSWPKTKQKHFKLHVHDIEFPKDNADDWKKLFKKCATQRLFLPKLMADTDSVIYVDTDILFLRPVDDLWERFSEFNSSHISGLVPEHEDAHVSWYKRFARHPYYPPLGVNSGVMLMNLTRMREANWLDHIIPYYHKYRYNITWGDQDLINVFFHYFPDKLYIYPCDWNYRQDHCMYMHVCKRAEQYGVSILHGARGVYHNEKELSFRGVYEAIRNYQFGTDVNHLLENMKKNVKKANHTNCGKVGWVLTKQFESQIEKRFQKNEL